MQIPHRNSMPSTFSDFLREAIMDPEHSKELGWVCEFYAQDYACFGYSVPVACQQALAPAQKKNGSKRKGSKK